MARGATAPSRAGEKEAGLTTGHKLDRYCRERNILPCGPPLFLPFHSSSSPKRSNPIGGSILTRIKFPRFATNFQRFQELNRFSKTRFFLLDDRRKYFEDDKFSKSSINFRSRIKLINSGSFVTFVFEFDFKFFTLRHDHER